MLYEGEAELPRSTGATGGDNVAIDGDLGGGVGGTCHGVLKAGEAGGLLALEQS